jgi:hypothetical protein
MDWKLKSTTNWAGPLAPLSLRSSHWRELNLFADDSRDIDSRFAWLLIDSYTIHISCLSLISYCIWCEQIVHLTLPLFHFKWDIECMLSWFLNEILTSHLTQVLQLTCLASMACTDDFLPFHLTSATWWSYKWQPYLWLPFQSPQNAKNGFIWWSQLGYGLLACMNLEWHSTTNCLFQLLIF